MSDAPIDSLTRVVEARPDDLPPWPHLAGPVPGTGRSGRASGEAGWATGAAGRAAAPSAGRAVRDTREGESAGAAVLDRHVPR